MKTIRNIIQKALVSYIIDLIKAQADFRNYDPVVAFEYADNYLRLEGFKVSTETIGHITESMEQRFGLFPVGGGYLNTEWI